MPVIINETTLLCATLWQFTDIRPWIWDVVCTFETKERLLQATRSEMAQALFGKSHTDLFSKLAYDFVTDLERDWDDQYTIVEHTLEEMAARGIQAVNFTQEEFPFLLWKMRNLTGKEGLTVRPCVLYVRGPLRHLQGDMICIDGTSTPSFNGREIAMRLAKGFTQFAWTICVPLQELFQPGAYEDTCVAGAVYGALATQGQVVGTLFSSFKDLSEELTTYVDAMVGAGGCVVSAHHDASVVVPMDSKLNRELPAALSAACLIVQTNKSGSAVQTAISARNFHRLVYAVLPIEARHIDMPQYEGNRWLHKSKAHQAPYFHHEHRAVSERAHQLLKSYPLPMMPVEEAS